MQYPSFARIYQTRIETGSVVICCDVMRSVPGAVATGSNSATVEIWLRLTRSLPLPVLTSLSKLRHYLETDNSLTVLMREGKENERGFLGGRLRLWVFAALRENLFIAESFTQRRIEGLSRCRHDHF